jgi:hypothetical protein
MRLLKARNLENPHRVDVTTSLFVWALSGVNTLGFHFFCAVAAIAFAAIGRYTSLRKEKGRSDMAPLLSDVSETVTPSAADTQLAQESSRQLAKILGTRQENVRVRIQADGREEESIAIPVSAFHLLTDILTEMAKGNAVTLIRASGPGQFTCLRIE